MATAPQKKVEPKAPATTDVRVQVLAGRLRHPITGTIFREGAVVDVIDLDSDDNAFVRHQIEAGLFKVLD
jgi:hypothetical protein